MDQKLCALLSTLLTFTRRMADFAARFSAISSQRELPGFQVVHAKVKQSDIYGAVTRVLIYCVNPKVHVAVRCGVIMPNRQKAF
ncbi:hypothetical protein KCU99_g58, partial [Aureobasidium melanogenum]